MKSVSNLIYSYFLIRGITDNNTKIIPGHGPPGTKAMMVEFHQMLVGARARVAQLITQGLSEDEAVAAKPYADYSAALGANAQRAGNFVRVVYRSLVK